MRISFTLLDLWDKGRVDEAVQTYFHLKKFTNQAMEEGKEIHQKIADHIKATGKFPDYMPQLTLSNPIPEKRVVVSYNEDVELSCYMDCLDDTSLFEYKTGVTEASEYVRSMQVPMYFLICQLIGVKVDRAYIIHHNQRFRTNDWLLVWNDPHYEQAARNYIDTLYPEIYKFFDEQGFI